MTKEKFTSGLFKTEEERNQWVDLMGHAGSGVMDLNQGTLHANTGKIMANAADSFIALEEKFPDKHPANSKIALDTIEELVKERLMHSPDDTVVEPNYIRQILDSNMEDSAVAVIEAGRRAAKAAISKKA